MATLIRVGTSSQGEEGRCDAKCYTAKGGRCTCCCGGRNHGVGADRAIEQTQSLAASYLAQGLEVAPELLQLGFVPPDEREVQRSWRKGA